MPQRDGGDDVDNNDGGDGDDDGYGNGEAWHCRKGALRHRNIYILQVQRALHTTQCNAHISLHTS